MRHLPYKLTETSTFASTSTRQEAASDAIVSSELFRILKTCGSPTMNHKIRIANFIILSSLAIGILLCLTNAAKANGAVWNPGTIGGSLGPVKQSDLVLTKEHVTFYDDVNYNTPHVAAHFRIFNPTKTNLAVTMGFPIDYSEALRKWGEQSERQYVEYFTKEFNVRVNGEKVPVRQSKDASGVYSLVFLWDILFPQQKTIEISVEYPFKASEHGADGEDSSSYERVFRYITHTGAYWAKPIQQATFEYCSDNFMSIMLDSPSGSSSKPEDIAKTTWRDVSWWVKPKPYNVDRAAKCIIWKRSNWTPVKGADDIEVGNTYRIYGVVANPFLPSAYLDRWCGKGENTNYKQFGEKVGIRSTPFSDEYFNSLKKKAFFYPETEESSESNDGTVSLSNEINALLLRYLRNYIYAVHGHQFKDQQLASCFSSIKHADQWTDIEKSNVEAILRHEKAFKETK